MEDVELLLYYKLCHCTDGYVVFIGCPTIDDEEWFTITGIGISKTLDKALTFAKDSASEYMELNMEYVRLAQAGKSVWQIPDEDFIDLEKELHDLD